MTDREALREAMAEALFAFDLGTNSMDTERERVDVILNALQDAGHVVTENWK